MRGHQTLSRIELHPEHRREVTSGWAAVLLDARATVEEDAAPLGSSVDHVPACPEAGPARGERGPQRRGGGERRDEDLRERRDVVPASKESASERLGGG